MEPLNLYIYLHQACERTVPAGVKTKPFPCAACRKYILFCSGRRELGLFP